MRKAKTGLTVGYVTTKTRIKWSLLYTSGLRGISLKDCISWTMTEVNRVITNILVVVLTEKPEYHCDTQQDVHDNEKNREGNHKAKKLSKLVSVGLDPL
jgi:hypothetical protein